MYLVIEEPEGEGFRDSAIRALRVRGSPPNLLDTTRSP